ncbi:MAG: CBS domain-containing protein [Rhodocyclaceae bacterium]|nr:CBS domain-containing protein [Rhodocyclaceae bacterium]
MSISGIVRDLMIPLGKFPHVGESATLRDAFAMLHLMPSEKGDMFRNVVVLDDQGHFLGLLSLKNMLLALMPDYLRPTKGVYQGAHDDISALALLWQEDCLEHCHRAHTIRVRDHLQVVGEHVTPHEPLTRALYLFATTPHYLLPVIENKRLIGMLRLVDAFDEIMIEVLSERPRNE